ncbi:MAG TPA: hypothetical protein VLA78_03875 [Paracoccaceae bacterium]|jgi:hypothetical protein|nr:hypothetical protein [Paracoccaceae bacterium]
MAQLFDTAPGAATARAQPVARGQAPAALARAILALPLTALAPDGRMAPQVLDRVVEMCAAAPVLAATGPGPVRAYALAILRAIAAQGAGPVLSALVPALTPPLAETALCLALRAAMDERGALAARDRQVLGALARRLGLDPAVLDGMQRVLAVLDRPAP